MTDSWLTVFRFCLIHETQVFSQFTGLNINLIILCAYISHSGGAIWINDTCIIFKSQYKDSPETWCRLYWVNCLSSFQIAKLKGIFLFSSDAATRTYNVIDQSPFEPRHIHNISYHLINVFMLCCFKQSPHLLNTCFPWRLITSCYIFIKRFFWCKQRLSLFPMRWGASTEIHTVYLCHYITKSLQNQFKK